MNKLDEDIKGAEILAASTAIISIFYTLLTIGKWITAPKDSFLTDKLNKVLKQQLPFDKKEYTVKIIETPGVNAFVSPFSLVLTGTKPTIFATSALLNLLKKDSDETIAVLLHEVGHLKNFDVITIILITALQGTVWGNIAKAVQKTTVDSTLKAFLFTILLIVASFSLQGTVSYIRRVQENRADMFTKKLGFGDALSKALYIMTIKPKIYPQECGTICKAIKKIELFLDSHPESEERIKALLTKKETLQSLKDGATSKVSKMLSQEILFTANQYALKKNLLEYNNEQIR